MEFWRWKPWCGPWNCFCDFTVCEPACSWRVGLEDRIQAITPPREPFLGLIQAAVDLLGWDCGCGAADLVLSWGLGGISLLCTS